MARIKVQFHKGLSEADFSALYGSEETCRRAVFSWRWPSGFECPACGGRDHCVLDRRDLYLCNAYRTKTSLTAGTIFANTKLALTTWFRAMYLVTQSKQGISTVELGRRLGVRQTTAWSIKSKLTQVMFLSWRTVQHPDNVTLRMLRSLDSELDHVVDELGETKTHVGRLERAWASVHVVHRLGDVRTSY